MLRDLSPEYATNGLILSASGPIAVTLAVVVLLTAVPALGTRMPRCWGPR